MGLYVHLPYCRYRCPYCDFNKYPVRVWPETDYVDALAAEIGHYGRTAPWDGATVETIFFGGGTPSLFSAPSIGRILAAVRAVFPVAHDAEVTLEANPETVTRESLDEFHANGVNRLSLGVQSFHATLLRTLGRRHSPDDGRRAVSDARAAGFSNVSLDLMFGIPGQQPAEWATDLETALDLAPEHLSTYGLTYEPGTPLAAWREKGRIRPVSEDTELAMYTHARERLGAAGYVHYEISNFARPGRVCRHNLACWEGQSYLGIGAGAHSFSARPAWGRRWGNHPSPEDYMRSVRSAGHARAEEETLDRQLAIADCLLLSFRLCAGLSESRFRERFGCDLVAERPAAARLEADGLLARVGDRWTLTAAGLPLADSVVADLLAA